MQQQQKICVAYIYHVFFPKKPVLKTPKDSKGLIKQQISWVHIHMSCHAKLKEV